MTIGTLALLSDSEIRQAVELLAECRAEIIESVVKDTLMMGSFKGLEYMNDDPGEVDVLYAKIQLQDGSDR